jgi:uncharacterized membrane protein
MKAARSTAHLVAVLGWCLLIAFSLLWELVLDPGTAPWLWAAIKSVPLLIALPGVLRANNYTLQWASMLVLLYMAEGCVRGMSAGGVSQLLGWVEFALSWITFFGIVLHLRPLKKQAKQEKAQHSSDAKHNEKSVEKPHV